MSVQSAGTKSVTLIDGFTTPAMITDYDFPAPPKSTSTQAPANISAPPSPINDLNTSSPLDVAPEDPKPQETAVSSTHLFIDQSDENNDVMISTSANLAAFGIVDINRDVEAEIAAFKQHQEAKIGKLAAQNQAQFAAMQQNKHSDLSLSLPMTFTAGGTASDDPTNESVATKGLFDSLLPTPGVPSKITISKTTKTIVDEDGKTISQSETISTRQNEVELKKSTLFTEDGSDDDDSDDNELIVSRALGKSVQLKSNQPVEPKTQQRQEKLSAAAKWKMATSSLFDQSDEDDQEEDSFILLKTSTTVSKPPQVAVASTASAVSEEKNDEIHHEPKEEHQPATQLPAESSTSPQPSQSEPSSENITASNHVLFEEKLLPSQNSITQSDKSASSLLRSLLDNDDDDDDAGVVQNTSLFGHQNDDEDIDTIDSLFSTVDSSVPQIASINEIGNDFDFDGYVEQNITKE